jgi:hypothetical protein
MEAGAGGRDGSAAGGAGGGAGGAGDASLNDAIAPSGPRTVALLHGLTDSPWVAFCFSKVEDGVEGPLAPELFPSGGLLYGASVPATDLPGGMRFGDDSVRPYVVAASSEDVVRGLDCRAIAARTRTAPVDAGARVPPEGGAPDAGGAVIGDGGAPDGGDAGAPPPVRIADVRMAALPVLPARALSPAESYLVAIAGCLGGSGVTAPAEVSICGVGYSVNAPTLVTSVVRLSRQTAPRAAGLQFLVATPAFGQADLRLIPPRTGDPIVVAKGVGVGALRPVQPYLDASAADIGAGSPGALVRVSANGSTLAAYDEPWDPTLAAGGIETLSNGQTYTLVLLGPTPGFTASQWWNGALVTIVQNTE